jgi:hypothetical protein
MNFKLGVPCALLPIVLCLWGCQGSQRQDTVVSSVTNPSGTYRATIVVREYFIDGHLDNSPTTYVLLDKNSGKPEYDGGQDFRDSEVVMKPAQCGPLSLRWDDDHTLKILCEKCGIALSAIGQHARGVGAIQVDYEGFPDMSSWEAAPRGGK